MSLWQNCQLLSCANSPYYSFLVFLNALQFFFGWVPNLSGELNFFANAANQKTERSLLVFEDNNLDSISSCDDFKTVFCYDRFLDDSPIADLVSFGSKNFIEKKINKFLAGKDVISFPSRYLAYAEHSSDFELLSKNNWFQAPAPSNYAGFKSFLRIVFFKCVIDDDDKWSDFKKLFLDGLSDANYDSSKKTMESFDNKSKVMMEAILFRNGFVLIRGDKEVGSG